MDRREAHLPLTARRRYHRRMGSRQPPATTPTRALEHQQPRRWLAPWLCQGLSHTGNPRARGWARCERALVGPVRALDMTGGSQPLSSGRLELSLAPSYTYISVT